MLYGKELAQSIQKRCKIQPGMLVKSTAGTTVSKVALVVGLSPGCKFDRDYEGSEEHVFYNVVVHALNFSAADVDVGCVTWQRCLTRGSGYV